MATARKRRRDITLKEKYEMIVYTEQNPEMSLTGVAKKFSIPRTTLSGIISKAVEIKNAYDASTVGPTSKRLRKSSFDDVDVSLFQWLGQVRSAEPDFCVSGDKLLDKANEFAESFGYEKPINMSWISRWKRRHRVMSKKLTGEAASTLNNNTEAQGATKSINKAPVQFDTDDDTVTPSDAMESLDKLSQYLLTCKSAPPPRFLECLVEIESFIEMNIIHIEQ